MRGMHVEDSAELHVYPLNADSEPIAEMSTIRLYPSGGTELRRFQTSRLV